MDDMDVDTTSHVHSSHHSLPMASKPLVINPSRSRFSPCPPSQSMASQPSRTPPSSSFAPAPVSDLYSGSAFKPVSTTSPPPAFPNPSSHPAAITFRPANATSIPTFTTSSPTAAIPVTPGHPLSQHNKNSLRGNTTPFKPTPPVQISRAPSQKPSPYPESAPIVARSLGSLPNLLGAVNFSSSVPIPQSLPNIQPSYPATLFGGLSADDEHVTVWEPSTGKTVAGNAAPYRRNLSQWLKCHPGWEEKADELKSSKRRSAAKRGRNAADAFAALCHYPVASFLVQDAAKRLHDLGGGNYLTEESMSSWGSDDFVRLQEALFRLAQDCHSHGMNDEKLDKDRWAKVSAQVGGPKQEGTVVSCAHHMLTCGVGKSHKEIGSGAQPSSLGVLSSSHGDLGGMGSPASLNSYEMNSPNGFAAVGPSSMPNVSGGLGALLLERSFRAQREPRVTVWNPENGRTISGNAAPCRRNLETWMRDHPGWRPKEEGQLSSSRRGRKYRSRPSSLSSAPGMGPLSLEPESPHFKDAIQGLLFLSRSPSGYSPDGLDADDSEMGDGLTNGTSHVLAVGSRISSRKNGIISSVSSSSADERIQGDMDDVDEDDDEDDEEEDEDEEYGDVDDDDDEMANGMEL